MALGAVTLTDFAAWASVAGDTDASVDKTDAGAGPVTFGDVAVELTAAVLPPESLIPNSTPTAMTTATVAAAAICWRRRVRCRASWAGEGPRAGRARVDCRFCDMCSTSGERRPGPGACPSRPSYRSSSGLGDRVHGAIHGNVGADRGLIPGLAARDEPGPAVERHRRHSGVAPQHAASGRADMGDDGGEDIPADALAAPPLGGRHAP